MQQVLANIQQVPYRRLVLAMVLFWLPLIVFVKLATDVQQHQPIGLDSALLSAVHDMARPAFDHAVIATTHAGSAEAVGVITLLAAGFLTWKHWRRHAALLLFGVGGAAVSNLILKVLFQRERPMLWEHMVIENGYSFPSGHAMASSALAFVVVFIFWRTQWRWVAVGLGALYMIAVGFSRLYVGVHYPSDIMAAWCISFVWVLTVYVILQWGLAGRSKVADVTGEAKK